MLSESPRKTLLVGDGEAAGPQGTAVERELKIAVAHVDSVRAAVEAAGGKYLHGPSFEDNVIFDRDSRLYSRSEVLRLRTDDRGSRLAWKGAAHFEDGVKVRDEHEVALDDPDAITAILIAIGYQPVRRYQKIRDEWLLGGCHVALDQTPIGHFVEVEGDEPRAVFELLGLDPEQAEPRSYLSLWNDYRRENPEEGEDMLMPEPPARGAS